MVERFNFLFLLICCVLVGAASALPHTRLAPNKPGVDNPLNDGYTYQTMYITQNVDHFGFANSDQFKQRYLLADQFWNQDDGPIFFYTGNEGDITWICNNTGFMWDIAPEFKALLVFAEHRYYGESLPYGSQSLDNNTVLNYLTSEQALADYAELIRHLKQTVPGSSNSPVIVFGGSYGGMLAAWMRMKYPSLVLGALASSAPIWQFVGLTPCDGFYNTVQKAFESVSKQCVLNIRNSWSTLTGFWQYRQTIRQHLPVLHSPLHFSTAARTCLHCLVTKLDPKAMLGTAGDLDFLTKTFSQCQPIESKYDLDPLMDWIVGVLVNLATVNYPYPASFLEPLPANPVQEFCKNLEMPLSDKPLMEAMAKGVKMYFNYTGQAGTCLDRTKFATKYFGDKAWYYQTCTELVMPKCTTSREMFYYIAWDIYYYTILCQHNSFGINTTPREKWIPLQYWGKNITAASNIIFSNGMMSPLAGGGVLESLSPSLIAIQIPSAAQHLDLRGQNPADPADVKAAREQEKNILKEWLYGYQG